MAHLRAGNGADPTQPSAPDLVPSGDPEADLTQLVTLIEHWRFVGGGPDDIFTFAAALRARWDEES